MRNFAATTHTTADRRTTAACGSSTAASGVSGRSGWIEGRGEGPSHGKPTHSSSGAIRSCAPGSRDLGPARRGLLEEPTAVILHGGVCEGGGSVQRCCLALPYSARDCGCLICDWSGCWAK